MARELEVESCKAKIPLVGARDARGSSHPSLSNQNCGSFTHFWFTDNDALTSFLDKEPPITSAKDDGTLSWGNTS